MRSFHPKPSPRNPFRTLALVTALLAGCGLRVQAQQNGQKHFENPEEASQALFQAAQNNDQAALLRILGSDAKGLLASGDEAEDSAARTGFVQHFQEMHRLVQEPDGNTTLYLGAENWPTPIPLVAKNGTWFFDTEAGKQEILLRRIGRNETSTIRVCQELAQVQQEFSAAHNHQFATAMHSDAGQHNGLYWTGEPQSPIGPLLASAGHRNAAGAPTPFRGYCYRMLPAHGQGFAFVAYPAEYRSSGVMTFLINQQGVVYEKDLGRATQRRAQAMQGARRDATWRKTEDHPE